MYFNYLEYFTIADGVLGLVQLVVLILSIVFFIMWFRRAYNNLHICQVKTLPFSEGWASGSWFVPIISLHYPYRIMKSIWIETQLALRKQGERYETYVDGYLGWWWTFWLIGNIVSNIQAQLTLRGEFSIHEPGMIVMELISDSSMLIAAYLCWRMIKKTSAMEDDLHQRYNEWLAFQTQQKAEQYQQNQSLG